MFKTIIQQSSFCSTSMCYGRSSCGQNQWMQKKNNFGGVSVYEDCILAQICTVVTLFLFIFGPVVVRSKCFEATF